MIKLNGVTKNYNDRVVINNIDFTFDDGKFYSIIGASGSGKSTLLYLMSGLETTDCGNVLYNDISYSDADNKELAKLRRVDFGFIFQFYNLIPNISVLENIIMPMYMNGIKKKQAIIKVKEITKRLGIEEQLNKYPSQLSGGEQQRVAIARALLNNPKVIFADEPTGNLDSKTGESVMNLILELHKELEFTLIMVTHNPAIAERADVQITLLDGKIANISQ